MNMKNTVVATLVAVLAISFELFAQQKEFHKTYANIDEIVIHTSLISRYVITASNDQDVHIDLTNADDQAVRHTIDETGRALRLGDKDLNYHPNRPTPCDIIEWKLQLPKSINVRCKGSTTRLSLDSFEGSISVATASGALMFNNSRGTFEVSAANADIEFHRCAGVFNVRTGGGADIDASGIIIEGKSRFSTNGGDVEIVLSKTPQHDVLIATGTGDGILDYDGNNVLGSFTFSTEKGRGKIVSPFPFDEQTTYKDDLKIIQDKDDVGKRVDYLSKHQVIGNSSPEIVIRTIRGRAVLKK